MLSEGDVLPHDNARHHSAGITQKLFNKFGWEQFDHPPYSPLTPSDYHLFLNLKFDFGVRRFGSNEDAKNSVHQWLFSHPSMETDQRVYKR